MAFFKLKKRCPYCGTALDKGNCPNTGCINHQDETTKEDASRKEG
ncbi:hypothetical protein [Acidaminococcus fermentans]